MNRLFHHLVGEHFLCSPSIYDTWNYVSKCDHHFAVKLFPNRQIAMELIVLAKHILNDNWSKQKAYNNNNKKKTHK